MSTVKGSVTHIKIKEYFHHSLIVQNKYPSLSFSYADLHKKITNKIAPSIEIWLKWPPLGIVAFNPINMSILNTIILLSSGICLQKVTVKYTVPQT